MTKKTEAPIWVSDWLNETGELDSSGIDWMRSRPESIKELMLRFPPSCVVCHARGLLTADEGYAIITSYSEDGLVSVRPSPDASVRGQVDPEELEVVGYWHGLTPERVAEILA